MSLRAGVLILGLLAAPAAAQDAAEFARDAAQQLAAAQVRLSRADGARDRVQALTDAVLAYEAGLSAAREGLRSAVVRETTLSRQLAAQETDIARLLGALQGMSRAGLAETALHPDGPLATVRGGMMLADLAPSMTRKAQDLRASLEEIAALRAVRKDTVAQLQSGLADVEAARLALSQAIASRTDLPKRFAADPVRMALLANAAQSLDDFARTIAQEPGDTAAQTSIAGREGRLPLPARGQILRQPGEADAAGIRRPGLTLATEPRALVTAPVSATLRFRGAMPGHGMVAILEPQPGMLILLTGMAQLFGTLGEVLPQGAPVGLMSGQIPDPSSQSGENTGTLLSETLYIEVRQSGAPVDPLIWFTTNKE